MKQIYEDLSDDTDFDIIDLDDVPDRDTVKRRKKKSQRDVNKTNKSEEVNTLPPKILQRIHERSGLKKPGNVLPETLETAVQKLPGKSVPLHPLRSSPLR